MICCNQKEQTITTQTESLGGGDYTCTGYESPASCRFYSSPSGTSMTKGFLPALYLHD